jgi:hypothetical protein
VASLAADAIQPSLVPGLTTVQGRPSGTSLTALFAPGRRQGFDLTFDDAANTVLMDFRDRAVVLDAIASDSSRFASAAVQTIAVVPSSLLEAESVSWGLIKAYYAAFYSGHALMRMLGDAYTYIDRSHCAYILSVANAIGTPPGFPVQAGPYRCSLANNATSIECEKLGGAVGGAHELFWSGLGARFKVLGEDILNGPLAPSDSQAVFAKLADHARCCNNAGTPPHSWLSVVRNDLQYRQGFGAWIPCSINKHSRERLSRLSEQWRRDPLSVDLAEPTAPPLVQFIAASVFLVALCVDLLKRVAERSSLRARSFATVGPLSLLP